ncbi:hypothetical protein Q4574_14700 [Aliiglaciecola sp. 3_MG-2023]|uniref:hypothetical protein n=1 Tax=Aliiglaciecola sp. 3_MG-2023 TaxID=3062644 RepID=UPI0026E31E48|nr:hypothetical protein [Aliiglaciecola sp. 3_MG-2023]MDO6694543.1 hypothetical protein [Aliiglaciecola sp. 3_MG-2023]
MAFCVATLWAPKIYAESDKLAFSGFARVVMGHLDDENAEYVGYDNSISFDQQSLLALQADYTFSEQLSLTAQVIGHTAEQRASGLEWLYLTYTPTDTALQIKLGKQRIPFFNYSDSIDVGFAYPWLTLPQQFYDTAFFSTFEGVLANYQYVYDAWVMNFEGYWGYYDDKIYLATGEIDTKVTGLYGFNTSASYNGFTFRAAYNQGNANLTLPGAAQFVDVLNQYGFSQNAESLNPDGLIHFYQLSANYENVDYFVRSEVAKMKGESGPVPDIDSFYISVGYNFYPYTIYISYGERDVYYEHGPNEIPYGISDELDYLAATYESVLSGFPDDKNKGTKIGLRWDWRYNVALKGEVTYVDAEKVSNDFALKDLGGFDGHAILYQLGIEWVFL